MKDGAYLLVLPDKDYGTPVTVKNQTNPDGTVFQIVASVAGVQLLSNLDPGFELLPMLVMTPMRIAALHTLIDYAEPILYGKDIAQLGIVRAMIDEAQPD